MPVNEIVLAIEIGKDAPGLRVVGKCFGHAGAHPGKKSGLEQKIPDILGTPFEQLGRKIAEDLLPGKTVGSPGIETLEAHALEEQHQAGNPPVGDPAQKGKCSAVEVLARLERGNGVGLFGCESDIVPAEKRHLPRRTQTHIGGRRLAPAQHDHPQPVGQG